MRAYLLPCLRINLYVGWISLVDYLEMFTARNTFGQFMSGMIFICIRLA